MVNGPSESFVPPSVRAADRLRQYTGKREGEGSIMWEKHPPGTSSFTMKHLATVPPEGHTNHTATPESIDKVR